METATAATSATAGPLAADRPRELAANLNSHRGFADVVVSLEAECDSASTEQSFEKLIARDVEMSRHVA